MSWFRIKYTHVFLVLALSCLTAIIIAISLTYFMKLTPCTLCLEQRTPYYMAIILSILGIINVNKSLLFTKIILILIGAGFLYNIGLGIYHIGIEQGFWMGPQSCSGSISNVTSIEALHRALNGQPAISCKTVQWSLWGISFAGWNILMSASLSFFSFFQVYKGKS